MSRFARKAKSDANQAPIVAALRKVGASVELLTAVGGGVPDLLVGFRGRNYLLEVKNPATRYGRGKNDNSEGSTVKQARWHAGWRGGVHVVTSIPEALAAVGIVSAGPRSAWGGFALCRCGCGSTLTTDEEGSGISEACAQRSA